MILDKLKSETSAFHHLAEKINFSDKLKQGSINKEEYTILLKRLSCFFSQAKIIAANYADDAFFNAKLFEEKIHLLQNDLKALGATGISEHIVFDKLNYFDSIGFCYVPLGSMLGGKMIYNNLLKMQVNESLHLPISFYESCKDCFTNWNTFSVQLNLIDENDHNDILNGAKLSYLHFLYLCTIVK